jgi:hypothetical protein
VEDGFHHGALGVVAHIEDGGDDAGADLLKVALGDARVNAVAEDAVEVVDDDVVDVFLRLDPGDHLLETWPFVDIGGATTWFDELAHNIGVKRVRLALARFPLGRDGDALRVVVSLHLTWRRYPEVEHGTLAALLSCSEVRHIAV